ncbi:hypothetical protein DSO57_1018893 [Entomophthora muscae]|uniref:Uncharacterized protein n=2 Tax=Entomophthora muscae TaxID=34485 RepID=A0ACC2RVD4_9FUNG|nr:hypothetical protein DSO57_1018893 [Entomophthora muscae]
MFLKTTSYRRPCLDSGGQCLNKDVSGDTGVVHKGGFLRQLGLLKFFTSSRFDHHTNKNGLPYALSTSEMIARFEDLKTLSHPNLCEQVELIIGKLGQVSILSEHYPISLFDILDQRKEACLDTLPISLFASQILQGIIAATSLSSSFQIVAFGNLNPRHVLLAGLEDGFSTEALNQATIKLAGFGLGHLTRYGQHINFPLSDPGYAAPEVILSLAHEWWIKPANEQAYQVEDVWASPIPFDARADVWSLGLIVAELLTGENLFLSYVSDLGGELGPYEGAYQALRDADGFRNYVEQQLTHVDPAFRELLKMVLNPDLETRPFPDELLGHTGLAAIPSDVWHRGIPTFSSQTQALTLEELRARRKTKFFEELSLADVVFLWRLNGCDLVDSQKVVNPDICALPDVVIRAEVGVAEVGGCHPSDDSFSYEISLLDWKEVYARILSAQSKPPMGYAPLDPEVKSTPSVDSKDCPSLVYRAPAAVADEDGPCIIYRRETDFEYQCHRLRLFRRLLSQLPASRDELYHHARWDIPPSLRGEVWAGLLGVQGDYRRAYSGIELSSVTQADRQIEVDVPRCHQYHPLLASSLGHSRLRAVLKAWVIINEGLVYWQGLDSLCAPFLALSFGDEALAFACLQRMIPSFLSQFFTTDNSTALQDRLQAFQQIMAYHDPQLAIYTHRLGFHPQLYAIPWFLTLFTHVLSLDKIYLLWDRFLAGPSALPLFVAVAITHLFRDKLLSSGFDQCITLFSGCFPDLDMELCLATAFRFYYATPESAVAAMEIGYPPQDDEPQSETAAWKSQGELSCTPWLSLEDFHRWRTQMLVIDVRDYEDYLRGHHAQSLHLEFPSEHHPYFEELLAPFVQQLSLRKWKCLVIVGDGDDFAQKVAVLMMRMYLPRVAILPADINSLVCATVSPTQASQSAGLVVCQCSPHRFVAHSRTVAQEGAPLPVPSGPPAPTGTPAPAISKCKQFPNYSGKKPHSQSFSQSSTRPARLNRRATTSQA